MQRKQFGTNAAEASAVAEVLARKAFHNVAYYPGAYETLHAALKENQ